MNKLSAFTSGMFIYLWILTALLAYRTHESYFGDNQTPIFILAYTFMGYLYLKKTSAFLYMTCLFASLAVIFAKSEISQFFALQGYLMFIISLVSFLSVIRKE